jgi:hypothetical protein
LFSKALIYKQRKKSFSRRFRFGEEVGIVVPGAFATLFGPIVIAVSGRRRMTQSTQACAAGMAMALADMDHPEG